MDLPQLRYGGTWNPRPGALTSLAEELRTRTRLAPRHEPTIVRAEDPALFRTPFLYVAGEGTLPRLPAKAEEALRRFVDQGGLVLFDSADGGASSGFEDGVRELLQRIVPGRELAPVSPEHVLYRSFYLLERPLGRTAVHDQLLAIHEEGRLSVLVMRNDLGGALAQKSDGTYRHPCMPGGEVQRQWAIRLGVNVLMYATCTDYKADPAHVETLLHARRWR